MKNAIISGVIIVAAVLLGPPTARSQGTLYVSSLDQPSAGTVAVGSDSWVGEGFFTGSNPGGYAFDSIQLAMTPATGDPSGFSVQLYIGGTGDGGQVPTSYLSTLTGSSDPVATGLYSYTTSDLVLSPSTSYFIVVTSGTAVASGAFAWSYETTAPATTGVGWAEGFLHGSSDGTYWIGATPGGGGIAQMALTASVVPEPDPVVLMGLPGLLFFAWRRWHTKAQAR